MWIPLFSSYALYYGTNTGKKFTNSYITFMTCSESFWSRFSHGSSSIIKIRSNLEIIAFESLSPLFNDFPFLKLPPIGLAEAMMLVLDESEHRTPLFAIDMVCYSMASRRAWWSAVILSNSSMQQQPRSERTSAPASIALSDVTGSLVIATVNPALVEEVPHI